MSHYLYRSTSKIQFNKSHKTVYEHLKGFIILHKVAAPEY